MTRINTNVAALRGLRSLNSANQLLGTSLTRLSTGLQINSGKDNPSGLVASESLRSQVTAIEQSIKNSNRANNVIATADSALGEVGGLLNQIRGLIQEGLNDGALSQSEIDANQLQIDAALNAINRISANTTFAGDKLIDGSKSFTTAVTATDSAKLNDFQVHEAVFGSNSTIEIAANVTAAAEKAELRYAGGSLSAPATIEVSGSSGSQVLFLGGASTVTNVRDAINAVSDVTGVEAEIGSGLVFSNNAVASKYELTNAAVAGTASVANGTSSLADNASVLARTSGAETAEFAVRAAGTAGDAVTIVFTDGGSDNGDATTITSVTATTITIDLGRSGGSVTSTLDDVTNLIEGDTAANALVAVQTDTTGFSDTLSAGTITFSGGADTDTNDITFTDARATSALGDPSDLGSGTGEIFVRLANDTANGSNAAAVSDVSTDASGNITITIELGDDGSTGFGHSASTLDDIDTAIQAHAQASSLVSVSGTDGATFEVTDTVANPTGDQLTGGANEERVVFNDGRATATAGAIASLGGTVSIQFVNNSTTGGGGDSSVTTASASTADADGNVLITVELADDNAGNTTSTIDDVIAAIAADQTAGGAAEYIDVSGGDVLTATSSNTAVAVSGPFSLTGGVDGDNNDLSFTDVRADPSAGTIRIDLNNDATANQTLSVNTVTSGDDHDITVTLATDEFGRVTSTAEDVAALLNADATTSTLLLTSSSGDGSEAVSDTGGLANGIVDAGSGALVLTSSNYGSNEFVEVNVLAGTFETTLSDSTTAATRDAGTDIEVEINGQAAQGVGLKASVKTATLDASLSFNETNNTVSNTATVTITGGGSLFQIGQEVSAAGQIGIGIEAVNTARLGGITGKLYELGTGAGKSLHDVGPNVAGAELVGIVEEAISRVSTLRGRLGALQKNVIETNIASLGVALENISEARSQITDTDFALETAALTKAQILSQAGLSTLAIANQNPSQVLSLLG